MIINVEVHLFAPSDMQGYGGKNPRVAEVKTLPIEITRSVLQSLCEGEMTVEGMGSSVTTKYNAINNTVCVKTLLPDKETIAKIKKLEQAGWVFRKGICKSYELEW